MRITNTDKCSGQAFLEGLTKTDNCPTSGQTGLERLTNTDNCPT